MLNNGHNVAEFPCIEPLTHNTRCSMDRKTTRRRGLEGMKISPASWWAGQ